jgi:trimeric autotransporter adhesin
MKTKILSGLICCLGIFSANAQTITAPVGQPLTITNAVDVTGGGINIMSNNEFKIGGLRAFAAPAGTYNALIGQNTGSALTSGQYNTVIGGDAGISITTADGNAFLGAFAGNSTVAGKYNMFFGTNSGRSNISGDYNTCIGSLTGYATNATGNTFIGHTAGINNTTGTNNVCIGYNAQTASAALVNAIAIGKDALVSSSNTMVLGNNVTTITGAGLPINTSGLRFANLTNLSPATPGPTGTTGRVLSVDGAGNVILVQITGAGVGTTSVGGPVAENWKEADGYLYNNSTNGVVIKGTGLDGNSLIVKGGVLSKEVNVKVEGSESWPDYVFKPNYKRMTLGEVEKFISINGHLPNVPSATEMAKTGNNLGQTDVKLLEKVEELTLYLLDMKKANDAQAAELKALKQQVSKLRKK